MSETKVCSQCGVEKPRTEYSKHSATKDGIRNFCKICSNIKFRDWYQANPEKARARSKAYYDKNPEMLIARTDAWKAANPEKSRAKDIRRKARKYGLTVEEYDAIVNVDRCESCGTTNPNHRSGGFVLDHCHTTGRVRGALCNPCNLSLGHMNDDPERIEGLLNYARRHSAITLASGTG